MPASLHKGAHPTLEETASLEQHRAFLEKAQALAHIGSWVAELDGSNRGSWSSETYRIFGVAVGEFDGSGDRFLEYVHPNDIAMVEAAVRAALHDGRRLDIEHRIITGAAETRWVHERADVERNADGAPVRMIGTVQDITERRHLEEQLRHAQKMEAVGRLAGGVAHDLNNALTAVIGYTELVLPQLEEHNQVREDIEEIRHAAARAASVAQQLLAFSRRQLLDPRTFNLNKTVEGMARLLERTLGNDISLHLVLQPGLPSILGDPGQIEQALVNLAVNARDAMPRGGALTVTTEARDVDESFAHAHPPMHAGRFVVVSVADTGHGLDPETKARIFEPFFTTKEADKGTGLGLAMVYSTLKQCAGFISVDSEPGKGATFVLYFPALKGEEPPLEPPVPQMDSSTPTILVVEDEPSVLNLVLVTLRPEGYRLLRATSGRNALDLLGSYDGRVDLLLTDATMPGMGGVELARELRARHPELPVIIMSGYAPDIAAQATRTEPMATLQKPFSPTDLRARVREVLASQKR